MLWRNKWLTADAKTIDDMITMLRDAANELEEMKNAGITLDPEGETSDDYARLVTINKKVAKKFGLEVMEFEE